MYLPMVREFAHVGMPYCYRCDFDCSDGCRNCGQQYAAELDRAIEASNGEAAAFIFEPVSGATLGAVVPPPGYLQSIAEICRRHGVLLIADEVMTGMGRTGRNFAVDHWNVAPDILVTAKGLSSGYAPLGAVIASKKVVDAIADGSGAFLHGFTYNAHPISLAAGRAVLRHLQSARLVEASDSSLPGTAAAHFKHALESLRNEDAVGDVRGIGLLWAVEFVADKASKRPFAPKSKFRGTRRRRCLQARTARLPHARQRRRHPRRPPSSGSSSRHHPRSDRLVRRPTFSVHPRSKVARESRVTKQPCDLANVAPASRRLSGGRPALRLAPATAPELELMSPSNSRAFNRFPLDLRLIPA